MIEQLNILNKDLNVYIGGISLHDLVTQVHSHPADQPGRLDLVDPVHSAQLYQPADDASDARGPSLATSANVRFVQTGFGLAFEPAVIVVFQQSLITAYNILKTKSSSFPKDHHKALDIWEYE